jgi:hypothetical protein
MNPNMSPQSQLNMRQQRGPMMPPPGTPTPSPTGTMPQAGSMAPNPTTGNPGAPGQPMPNQLNPGAAPVNQLNPGAAPGAAKPNPMPPSTPASTTPAGTQLAAALGPQTPQAPQAQPGGRPMYSGVGAPPVARPKPMMPAPGGGAAPARNPQQNAGTF